MVVMVSIKLMFVLLVFQNSGLLVRMNIVTEQRRCWKAGSNRAFLMSRSRFTIAASLTLAFTTASYGQAGPVTLEEPEVAYSVPDSMWNLTFGQHRARVQVAKSAPAVWAHLPWRLQMRGMDTHQIIVVNAATDKPVKNVVRIAADRMAGDVAFEAITPGEYFVYFLPLRPYGNMNDMSGYVPYKCEADPVWVGQNKLSADALAGAEWRNLPAAKALEFQARTELDRFAPMEVIASDSETKELLARHSQPLLLFPEDRVHTIRMRQDLPLRWIKSGPRAEFSGEAQRNEYYAFQIGLFAPKQAVKNVRVGFSGLSAGDGKEIPASAMTCFNTGGIDSWGKPFTKVVGVPAGRVQPLWLGVDVANNQEPGIYSGTVTIQADGIAAQTVAVRLKVLPEAIVARGDNEPWRHSRLRWLNSTVGAEDFVSAPYTPLAVAGQRLTCLGRTVNLGADGLPASIACGNQSVLAAPVKLVFESQNGPLGFSAAGTDWTKTTPSRVEWQTTSSGSAASLVCNGRMEFEGSLNFRVTINPATDLDLRDVRLELPFRPESADYFMGAGRGGGFRPKDYLWKWNGPYDSFWMGSVHAGLHCELRGGSYHGPMLNLYHPAPPQTWGNGGKGGVSIREEANRVVATAFSGPRVLKAGQPVTFEFTLLITPVKPLDPATHFSTRYFHGNVNWTPDGIDPTPTSEALAVGANVVNVHHATIFNPYINYPFLKNEVLRKFTAEMHRKHVKVKLYDTVRELSNMVTELWALRSLGDEVIANGSGGGYAWCQEHLITGYIPAWFQRFSDDPPDAAFVTSGESRWYNYYIEGIAWLVRNADIDGLYLDDVTYDRHILQRVRAVLNREKPGCLIDLHSNTGFSIGPANQYAEFMPYVDRPWFGESFNYNTMTPDQWLVEVSGIPFGLMGEMLHDGGNPWRGPIYGMTVRMGWNTNGKLCDPRSVWRIWDQFNITDARMIGYWEPHCPVKTAPPDVLATVYMKQGRTMLSLASWAPARTEVHLNIDWKALGLDPAKAVLYAPRSLGFQKAQQWKPTDAITVAPARGWLIILDETGPTEAEAVVDEGKLTRSVLLEENFSKTLSGDWNTFVSKHPGTSVAPGKDGLAIQACANVSAGIQRKLPPGVTAAECRIETRTDAGETWGTGLALFWPGGQALRVNLRGPDKSFGIDSTGGAQRIRLGHYEPGEVVHLRIRLDADRAVVEARSDDEDWQWLGTFPRDQFPGAPSALSIGKMSGVEGTKDYVAPGVSGTALIGLLRLYGQ